MDELQERNDILTAIVNVMLSRNDGPMIVPMDEIEKAWNKVFKYAMVDDTLLIEIVEE